MSIPLEAWKLHLNWHQTEEGEDYEVVEVGKSKRVGAKLVDCTKITIYGEDYYQNDGHIIEPYAVVEFEDGQSVHVYNMNKIFYRPTVVK